MDILYLLLPMSVLLVLAILGVFAWAVHSGQFEDVEREGLRILDAPDSASTLDRHQEHPRVPPEQSAASTNGPHS
jgi:cbb3-type cytochrome oxidase maturation protein